MENGARVNRRTRAQLAAGVMAAKIWATTDNVRAAGQPKRGRGP